MYDTQKKVKAAMDHYRRIIRDGYSGPYTENNYEWAKWTNYRHHLSITTANRFFISVMLDQIGNADRAWEAGEHFVANHFNDDFWNEIRDIHWATLRRICQYGFDGKTYAVHFTFNEFPKWIKTNARIMIDEYDSDPRNIWNNAEVAEIRNRFENFAGIRVALSRMATNILVRNYGIAGGRRVRNQLFLKPDVFLQRVMYRVGFIENQRAVLKAERIMKQDRILRSPADFDAAIWAIGKEYCHKQNPNCADCPINQVCNRTGL